VVKKGFSSGDGILGEKSPLACPRYSMLAADPDMLECTCHSALSNTTFLARSGRVTYMQSGISKAPPCSPEASANMHASLRQGTGEVQRLLLSYSFPLTSHIKRQVPSTSRLLADSREMQMFNSDTCTDRFRKDFTPPKIRALRYALCR